MRVYLPLQSVQRELDSRLLMAAHLHTLGHEVLIGPRPGLLAERRILGPGGTYLLSNALRKSSLSGGRVADLALVALDEEALVQDEARFVEDRIDIEILERCALYLCWGERHRDLVLSAFPQFEQKFRIVGNPRLELLGPNFRKLYSADASRIRETVGGRFVLFNAQQRLDELRASTGPMDFFAAARASAIEIPDAIIVVRPHPAGGDVRLERDSAVPNLFFANTGPVVPWLLGAEAVVHPGSTTAIEARLLGRPAIRFRSEPVPDHSRHLPDAVSEIMDSPAGLVERLREVRLGGSIPQPPLSPLNPYFSLDPASSSSKLIAESLDKLQPPGRMPQPHLERPDLRLRLKWRRHGAKDKRWSHIQLRAARSDVRARFAAICAAMGVPNQARITFPQPRVMRIRPSR